MKQNIKSSKYILLIIVLAAIGASFLRLTMFLSGSTVARLYNGLDTRADSILIGCASAFINRRAGAHLGENAISVMQRVALASAGALLLFGVHARFDEPNMIKYGYLAVALLSAAIVLYLPSERGGMLSQVLNNKLLVQTGKMSYGIYLWHYPIICMLQEYYHTTWQITFLVGIPVSYLVALFSFEVIEKPCLAIGKMLADDGKRKAGYREPKAVAGD